MTSGLSIRVRGTVQGVGFRPFVFRLAERHGLTGWVRNTAGTVEIELDGAGDKLEAFLHALRSEAPDVAHIDEVQTAIRPAAGYDAFAILVSNEDGGWQAVSADIATCDECLSEVLDPKARRYRYPFTNCTNCGPRFTIIESLPYDRSRTTMRFFPMCDDCREEFENPRDRRFHAQPIACPSCGPRVWLHSPTDWVHEGDPIIQTAELLHSGKIIAIKGLGGFQLACDATNEHAVRRLRERKHRYGKPLAIMVADADEAAKYAELDQHAIQLLTGRDRPIVVAKRIIPSAHHGIIASSVTGELDTLGVMLPYTPLHHLLLREFGLPLVMTSGNMSEEPIATGNDEAIRRLSGIADAFLLHNRDIYSRYDDSVIRVGYDRAVQIRRARGLAPAPIALPYNSKQDILAVGPQQKNTFALVKESSAFVSQHIGDLDNFDTSEAYRDTLDIYSRLFKVDPKVVAYDLHPDYFTTQFAKEHAVRVAVQHHHAHIVSCMVENNLKSDVIGVAYDGTGYGTDGAIWGSEIMIASWRGFERAGHLRYTPLLGGEAAVRDPRRMAASHLWAGKADLADFARFFDTIPAQDLGVWNALYQQGVNAPPTSSCGRLFDAFAALLGVSLRARYEGEPAVLLEAIADKRIEQVYPYDLRNEDGWIIDPSPAFAAAWQDYIRGRSTAEIAAAVHNTVADWTVEICTRIREEKSLNQVCLSGGCFQNLLLLDRTVRGLSEAGFEVFTQMKVPPNDGGVALGQATVAFAITDSLASTPQ